MVLAYPGILLVAVIWILTPVVALPVAWIRWYAGRSGQTSSGWREQLIFKGLIAATSAFVMAALVALGANVNPNIRAEPTGSRIVESFSVFGLPAALFSIYASIAGKGSARVSVFLVGLMTGAYWFFGFLSIFKPRWLL